MLSEDRIRVLRSNVTILANASPGEWLEGPGLDRVLHNAEAVPMLLDEVERLTKDNEALRVEIEQQRLDTITSTTDCYAGTCQHQFCGTVRRDAKREAKRLQTIIDQARDQLRGGVCDEFEVCKHRSCDVNWSVYGLLQFATQPQPGAGEQGGGVDGE